MTSAVYAGQPVPFLQLLLKHGADPNQSGYADGATPLIAAVSRGTLEQVKFLLQAGARLDLRKLNGQTALDVAQKAGRRDIVAVLEHALAAQKQRPATTKP
jgi:ankyrin repeat protein